MSIITKILVVLVALAAIVLTPLLVVYVNNATEIREKYEDQQTQRVEAQNTAKTIQNRLTRLQASFAELQKSMNNQEKALQAKISDAKTTAKEMQALYTSEKTRNIGLEQAITQMRAQLQEQSTLVANYTKELDERREKNLELNNVNIQLARTLAEAQTRGDTLYRQTRLLTEQMTDLESQYNSINEKYQELVSSIGDAVEEGDITPKPTEAIMGQVIEVREASGQTFVAINVGENDKVRKGMEFIVHDGNGNFLGNAVVNTVELNTAAAVVTLGKGQINVGSKVLAGTP